VPVSPGIDATLETDDRLEEVFGRISAIMNEISGVQLPEAKIRLVRSRLRKRLRALDLPDFVAYAELIEGPAGREELSTMVDVLTTNKTSFFREAAHFDFLWEHVFPEIQERGDGFRAWSAGCSSGEEPYSLAILLREGLPGLMPPDVRILATDLSSIVLDRARRAVYPARVVESVPPELRGRYFRPARTADGEPAFEVEPVTRSFVTLARLNLMAPWPMRGPFDLILCRNVMIYFDRETRERLVQRFSALLRPGGFLFVGHSEGLANLDHDLHYVQPAVYRK